MGLVVTNKDAIAELKKMIPEGVYVSHKRAESVDIAVMAVEKQIPKKYRDIGFEIQCGECGAVLPDLEQYDYCPRCGQAIEW